LDEVADQPDLLELREKALKQRRETPGFRIAVAACVLATMVGVGLLVLESQGRLTKIWGDTIVSALFHREISTKVGERLTVTLNDGSTVTLNTDGLVEIKYSRGERALILKRGQMLVEVAKDSARPFVVYAGDHKIVATGTAFDVRLSGQKLEVTMVEGHVYVDQVQDDPASSERGTKTNLRAGEQFILDGKAVPSVKAVDVTRATSWTSGKLVFLDTRLAEAVAEANRYTRTPIVLSGDSVGDLRISGVFRTGQIIEFANTLTQVYPLSMHKLPDDRISIVMK
jgi:transmembrane sensor